MSLSYLFTGLLITSINLQFVKSSNVLLYMFFWYIYANSLDKKRSFLMNSSKSKMVSLWIFDIEFLHFSATAGKASAQKLANVMYNPIFDDNENKQLVTLNDEDNDNNNDYDD